MDCALLSAAVGTTLFTAYLFSVQPLDRPSLQPGPSPSPFKVAILHDENCASEAQHHFLVTAQGDLLPTVAWKERRPCAATRSPRINSMGVSILLEAAGDDGRTRQMHSLNGLFEQLRTEGVGFQHVWTHAQVEAGGCAAALNCSSIVPTGLK
jgi:hypothetical protein